MDESTGEILAAVIITNDCHESEVLPDLLEATEADIEQVSGDRAYDTRRCYDSKAPPHPRDENLRAIGKRGRKARKRQANYHRRSIAETTMFRLKAIFGGKLRSCTFDNQAVELLLQCAALNRRIQVAKPDTVWVED